VAKVDRRERIEAGRTIEQAPMAHRDRSLPG
jgi:hypothetical protein